MKITDIKTIKLQYPYKKWIIADGCGSCGARGAFLILVETDTELTGIGESATFGGSMDAMEAIVEKQLKPLLLDEDPTRIEFLHQKMMWNNWANGRKRPGDGGGKRHRCCTLGSAGKDSKEASGM